MIECICIDSKNKPKEIPLSKWIQKDMKYHITHVWFHPGQGIQGVNLYEVRLGDESIPYASFRLSRFAVTEQGLKQIIQMMKDCSELNDVDINVLIKESELVVQE